MKDTGYIRHGIDRKKNIDCKENFGMTRKEVLSKVLDCLLNGEDEKKVEVQCLLKPALRVQLHMGRFVSYLKENFDKTITNKKIMVDPEIWVENPRIILEYVKYEIQNKHVLSPPIFHALARIKNTTLRICHLESVQQKISAGFEIYL